MSIFVRATPYFGSLFHFNLSGGGYIELVDKKDIFPNVAQFCLPVRVQFYEEFVKTKMAVFCSFFWYDQKRDLETERGTVFGK